MKPMSTGRSIVSPTISRSISTAIACSHLRVSPDLKHPADQHDRDKRCDLQAAGGAIEVEGRADVASGQVMASIAHPALGKLDAVVNARTGKLDAKRARHRSFRPPGIGRAVMTGIAEQHPDCPGR